MQPRVVAPFVCLFFFANKMSRRSHVCSYRALRFAVHLCTRAFYLSLAEVLRVQRASSPVCRGRHGPRPSAPSPATRRRTQGPLHTLAPHPRLPSPPHPVRSGLRPDPPKERALSRASGLRGERPGPPGPSGPCAPSRLSAPGPAVPRASSFRLGPLDAPFLLPFRLLL